MDCLNPMLSMTPELSLILFPVDKQPPPHPTPFTTCAFSFAESCWSPGVPFPFRCRVSHHLYIFLSGFVSVIIYIFSFPESCQSSFIHFPFQSHRDTVTTFSFPESCQSPRFPFQSRVGHHVYLFLSRAVSVTTCTFSFPEPCRSPRVPFPFQSRVGHHVYLFLSRAVSVTTSPSCRPAPSGASSPSWTPARGRRQGRRR